MTALGQCAQCETNPFLSDGEGQKELCSLNVRRELTEMSFLRAREVELGQYARED
jgi:hypothetical protein